MGPPPARESYLLGDKIIEICKMTGAQGVHPGYGFLSENAGFSRKCAEAGVVFIGPPASAIKAMGDKAESKNIMEAAGVPCVPGYRGENQDAKYLLEQADRIGYPLLVKAVLGGGGKGMKRINHRDEFLDQLASAKREAMSAIGDDVVLLERYITRPRHIELQVFGDQHGNYVHLFERDCSVQRRYQKVLEESPAPGLSAEKRHIMGSSAVSAARAVNYVGAGTVEFIFDRDTNDYYFMEMNTRLQVEHPVTEMVTKQDLVEWQLKVASGYPLPLTQEQLDAVGPQGHAIEARVYAEDPDKGFIPQTGTIRHLRVPVGNGVRVDTGVRAGDTVTPYYDPMISKLICWDVNRTEALRKLHHALQEYEIVGLNNNISFLLRCSSVQAFRDGDVDTSFIPKHHDEIFPPAPPADSSEPTVTGQVLAAATVMLMRSLSVNNPEDVVRGPWGAASMGFRVNGVEQTDTLDLTLGTGATTQIRIATLAFGSYHLWLPDGEECNVVITMDDEGKFVASVDGDRITFSAYHNVNEVHIWNGKDRWSYQLQPPKWAASSAQVHSHGSLLAPMPGRITRVLVAVGQAVKAGEPILTMEAMKMESIVRAPEDGIVKSITLAVGDLCQGQQVLAVIE